MNKGLKRAEQTPRLWYSQKIINSLTPDLRSRILGCARQTDLLVTFVFDRDSDYPLFRVNGRGLVAPRE